MSLAESLMWATLLNVGFPPLYLFLIRSQQLRRIGITIDRLNKNYTEMKRQVNAAHEATSAVIDEASTLMAQRRTVETKQQLVKAFRERFILSENEVAVLALTSEAVDDKFFSTLAKAKRISKDCEVLLGFENQTIGLELMEQTSNHVNMAFQKLYRWIQREFKSLNLENPQIGSSIRRALRVLAERPSLFQNCLDFFAEAREHVLSDAFFAALTGSSVAGVQDRSAKPIELVAHDSLRYVGDMLAWMHSAAVSEREALEVLFVSEGDDLAKGLQAGRENEVWRLIAEESEEAPAFDAVRALNELVDRDMSGASRILRQRVEQVIQTNEETIMAYKLANLLSFYEVTFSKLLTPSSVLVETLGGLESEALRQFRSLMRDHIATLQGDFQHAPPDLGPPGFLQEALQQLIAIMRTYDTSLASLEDRTAGFEPILAEAFDPFMTGCRNLSKSMGSPARSVFLINCCQAATAVIGGFDFTQHTTEKLHQEIEVELGGLVESQYLFFRLESGLDELFQSLGPLTAKAEDVGKIKQLESLQPDRLSMASQTLDEFLPSALMDAMENLKNLQDSTLARKVVEEAAERFCVDFDHVEDIIMLADEVADQDGLADSESEERQNLRAVFPRTSGEIRVLLS